MNALALANQQIHLPELPLEPDLFGRMLMDHYLGKGGEYFLRRDDNRLDRDTTARYFRSWEEMPTHQKCLLNHAVGQVLDLGAGAGQHSLVLQERGMAVTAVDASPLATEVCRLRGVRDVRVADARALHLEGESFDTVLLMGNNLGIAGTPEGMRQWLRRLHKLVRPGGQILADISDYTATREAPHIRYQMWNRTRRRYPGSIRLRVEYNGLCGPQFDWLLLKLDDLRQICGETGWRIKRCVQVSTETTYAIGLERLSEEWVNGTIAEWNAPQPAPPSGRKAKK